jgi:hypothetical protein
MLGLLRVQRSRLPGHRDTITSLYGCTCMSSFPSVPHPLLALSNRDFAETNKQKEEHHQLPSLADVSEYCWAAEEEVSSL